MDPSLTRRGFLAVAGGALVVGALAGCGGGSGGGGGGEGPVQIFALSGRGRRISNAAKKHNANKRFRNEVVADQNHAHLGDDSYVVPLTISGKEFQRLFGRGNFVADLRHV